MALRWAALQLAKLQRAGLQGVPARMAARPSVGSFEFVPSATFRSLSGATASGPVQAASRGAQSAATTSFAASAYARSYSSSVVNAQGETVEEIRSRIFGTHIGNGLRSGRKILRRKLLGQKLVDWYPKDMVRADPFMLSLKAEAAKLKLDRLRRRGKAPPKKGAGKRAGKKKR